jgi:hypothetical protein
LACLPRILAACIAAGWTLMLEGWQEAALKARRHAKRTVRL